MMNVLCLIKDLNNKRMQQRFLSTNSMIMIKYFDQQETYCLGNQSFLRNQVYLSSNRQDKNIEKYLFYAEIEGTSRDFIMQVEFSQPIYLRHKISNKYLSFSLNFEEETNDTTSKLELSSVKQEFKIFPCFQYQTKISNKVKFNEDIYFGTEINHSKLGYISIRPSEKAAEKKTLVGLNYKSKMSLHSYYQLEKEQSSYIFGQAVWLSHIESSTFLSTVKNIQQVVFQKKDEEDDLQSINGLWLIESVISEQGGKLHFMEVFKLKHLLSGKYLSFSEDFQMVEKDPVYKIQLQEHPTERSQFIFQSLKGSENKIERGSYLMLKHLGTKIFLGVRRKDKKEQGENLMVQTFLEFEDEDLFELNELEETEEEAIRFIFSVKEELLAITERLYLNQPFSAINLTEIRNIYINIISELTKLQTFQLLFEDVQDQMGVLVAAFTSHLQEFRVRSNAKDQMGQLIRGLMQFIYTILTIICKDHRENQILLFKHIPIFVYDIYKQVGAEELISCIFNENYSLLCKASAISHEMGNKSLVKIFLETYLRNNRVKDHTYWININKFLDLLMTILHINVQTIDINQRYISTELFQKDAFSSIFFDIKVSTQRIRIRHHQTGKYTEIEQIKDVHINTIIERLFELLSRLCQNRNFISKSFIHKYLNGNNQNGIQTIISYLNIPISKKLSNNLFSLITNLYVDSCPRINRFKPLGVMIFLMDKKDYSQSRMSQEENELSGRLKDSLLDRLEPSRTARPLLISNILDWALNIEPSLNSEEMNLYKEELYEKIIKNSWSPELLQSISILINLESYEVQEIIEIHTLLSNKIKLKLLTQEIIQETMSIFDEIRIYTRELELKKLTSFLKYKYCGRNKELRSDDIEFALPQGKKLALVNVTSGVERLALFSESSKYMQDYNAMRANLEVLYANQELKNNLIEMFINSNENTDKEALESIFNQIIALYRPKYEFLRYLTKSIIITNDQSATFEILFEIYKKLKHLISISEYWLCNDELEPKDFLIFLRNVKEITNYFYEDYIINSSDHQVQNHSKININRQLLVGNLGVHMIVFQLLKSNFFMLQGKTANFLLEKQKLAFSACFQFLYSFCLNCSQNKKICRKEFNILKKYLNLIELGQTKLLILLFENESDMIKQVKAGVVEKIVQQIVVNVKDADTKACEFNPDYLKLLTTFMTIHGKVYKPNVELLYRMIEKESIFKKICYLDSSGKKFNLNLKSLKNSPCQIPYIYHAKIIHLITLITSNLDSISTLFKNRIKDIISFDYLLVILASPDIYSENGTQAKLNFILKRQIIQFICFYFEKSDSLKFLYENEKLADLLIFYSEIFIDKTLPKAVHHEKDGEYRIYLKEYQDELLYSQQNLREYYLQTIKPFLLKLYGIFQKINNRDKNRIFIILQRLLSAIQPQELVQNHLLKKIEPGMDQIDLKWRNFVDSDENNSSQEKFAKKAVLEILRHQQSKSWIQLQYQQLFEVISQKQPEFIRVLMMLLRNLSEEQSEESDEHDEMENVERVVQMISKYIGSITNAKKQIVTSNLLKEHQIFSVLINYMTTLSFTFHIEIVRSIFYYNLKIINFLLKNDDDHSNVKELYKIFKEHSASHRFFKCLKEAISLISERVDSQKRDQDINLALSELYLCAEDEEKQVDNEALALIKNLCHYIPFTDYLRDQSQSPSFDFLDIIYNSFYFIIYQNTSSLNITVNTVSICESIFDCISSMLNGCNKNNQMYLIDNKFPDLINSCLKIEAVVDNRNKAELARRNRLLDEVIAFYGDNGIDVSSELQKKIKIIDFNHSYLINRFKYEILKLLYECILGNERVLSKVKIMIPIEFLKINMIWVYEDFLRDKLDYIEPIILRTKEPWEKIVETENLNGMFLMVGFYIYFLIEICQESEKEPEDEDLDVTNDEEKHKQKIVKKFFASINEKKVKEEKLKSLEKQEFGEEMKLFYKKYYSSYNFFASKSLTVEMVLFDNLIQVHFPKIPLCYKFTEKMEEKFINQANRISQEQKIKSLLEWEKKIFYELEGQEEFFLNLEEKYYVLGKVLRLVEDQDKILLATWAIACFVVIFFLLQNYVSPSFQFQQNFLQFVIPTTFFKGMLLLLIALNSCIGVMLTINLIARQIPFKIGLQTQEYEDSQEKKSGGFFGSYEMYVFKNVLAQTFFSIYTIAFIFLSIIHPFFSGFLLIYIVSRIEVGKQIAQAIMETWFSLIVASGLLIVFNYIYAIATYNIFYNAIGYGPICENLFRCLLMFVDQSLKSGSGFLGSQQAYDYQYLSINIRILAEILYVLFCQKVIFEIFSGTIIDKFSELREQSESKLEDQESQCYICGQERFDIDFELEGFEEHIKQTHNKIHYIFYLFYIRRRPRIEHGMAEIFVTESQAKGKRTWIPDGTSILKVRFDLKNKQKQEESIEVKFQNVYSKKTLDLKKLKAKIQELATLLNEENKSL